MADTPSSKDSVPATLPQIGGPSARSKATDRLLESMDELLALCAPATP